jgi:colanic acid biosynthesis glycosyl transferase WcaI
MRVLILSQWYAPEPACKSHNLAKELVARGHQVLSITGYPNYPQGHIYDGYRQRLWYREQLEGVQVLRLPLYPDHSTSVFRRSLNYLSFCASVVALGPILSESADVMWVFHPPLTVGVPAWWIGLTRRIPFVYNVHDMWPESLSATGMVGNRRVLRFLGRMASWIYRRAAAVTVVTPGFRVNLVAKGVPPEKVHVIPNWSDGDMVMSGPRDDALGKRFGFEGRFNVVYAGNIGLAQGLDTILLAADTLRAEPEVQFVLIGDGVDRDRLRGRAQAMELSNVRFVDYQPSRRIAKFLSWADVLYLQLRDVPLFRITIPSKVYSYMAAAKPILAGAAGDTADLINAVRCGVVCRPGCPSELAQAVLRLKAMSADTLRGMGNAGRRVFEASYTRPVVAKRHEALLRDVARRYSSRRAGAS